MHAISTEEFLQELLSNRLCVLDVRSPSEYQRGAIPGARSLPLFDDSERSSVGIAYHTAGRQEAIKVGLELVGPKLRSMVERADQYCKAGQRIGLYCWRGGMRSSAVAWLLELYGFEVVTLGGGYKAFRRFVLARLAEPYRLIVLSGMTGAGKTETLAQLARRGEATIDLEHLASHRGSAFGWLGLPPQPSQQQFENMLALELLKHRTAERIWIEDESRRIGTITIPQSFWLQMRAAPIVALEVPQDRRIERLVREYGTFPPEQLAACLRAIRHRLGAERTARALSALAEGRLGDVAAIALAHYDKSYRHSLRKRAERIQWVHADSPDHAAAQLVTLQPLPILPAMVHQ